MSNSILVPKLRAVDLIYFHFILYFYFIFDLFSIFLFLELRVRVKVTRLCYYTSVTLKDTVTVMITSYKMHRRIEKVLEG